MLGLLDRLVGVGELAGRPELEAQAVLFDGQALAQIAQQQRDEDLVGRDVQQRSFPGALAHRRECSWIVALAIEADPLDLHRQHVARRRAALRGLKEGQPWLVVADIAERHRRGQHRMNGLRRTLGIPAGARQESGQHVALEHAAGARQRHPGRAHRHHERLEFGNHRRRDPLRRIALSSAGTSRSRKAPA